MVLTDVGALRHGRAVDGLGLDPLTVEDWELSALSLPTTWSTPRFGTCWGFGLPPAAVNDARFSHFVGL